MRFCALLLLLIAPFLQAQSNLDTLTGIDWTPLDLPDATVPITNYDRLFGYGNTLYADVDGDLYRSDDAGQSWYAFGRTDGA